MLLSAPPEHRPATRSLPFNLVDEHYQLARHGGSDSVHTYYWRGNGHRCGVSALPGLRQRMHCSLTYTVRSIWGAHQKSRLCDTQSPASYRVDNLYDSGRSRSIGRCMYTSAGLPILAR